MCIFKGFRVILSCCGELFNTVGETFYKIDRYKTTPKTRLFNDKKTIEEITYVTVCQNCGHLIIKYRQKIKNQAGKKKLGNTLNLRGKEADKFFYENYENTTIMKETAIVEYKEKNFVYYEMNASVFEEIVLWVKQFGDS